jgi:hypothetical protein
VVLQIEELQGMLVADRDLVENRTGRKTCPLTYLNELEYLAFWPPPGPGNKTTPTPRGPSMRSAGASGPP